MTWLCEPFDFRVSMPVDLPGGVNVLSRLRGNRGVSVLRSIMDQVGKENGRTLQKMVLGIAVPNNSTFHNFP
jgi:hypothetical protein